MLRFLCPRLPPKTNTSHLQLFDLDGGLSRVIYYGRDTSYGPSNGESMSSGALEDIDTASDIESTDREPRLGFRYLVTNCLPPSAASGSRGRTSSLAPPFHIHLYEHEVFEILSGSSKFSLLNARKLHSPLYVPRSIKQGKNGSIHQSLQRESAESRSHPGYTQILLGKGSRIVVPAGLIHRFENASQMDELELRFGFVDSRQSVDSIMLEKDSDDHEMNERYAGKELHGHLEANTKLERFLRNAQTYRSDCSNHIIPRSMAQIMAFNYTGGVVPVPEWLMNAHANTSYPFIKRLLERIAPWVGQIITFTIGRVWGMGFLGLSGSYKEYYTPDPTCTIRECKSVENEK